MDTFFSLQQIKKSLGVYIFFLLVCFSSKAQLFQQDFTSPFDPVILAGSTSSTTVYATNPSVYVNSTNPSNSQFTSIAAKDLTSISVVSGRLQISRSGNQTYFQRKTNFPNTPGSLLMSFDFEVTDNAASGTSQFNVFIGSCPSCALTHTPSSSSPTEYHTRLRFNVSNGGTKLWNVGTNTQWVAGAHKVTLAVNNSGRSLTYLAPDNSCETIADDKFDAWIDNVKFTNDEAASNPNLDLTNFFMGTGSSPSSSITYALDNMLIDTIPSLPPVSNAFTPAPSGVGFTANWTPISTGTSGYYGVNGYNLDIATDAAFTQNLTTLFVPGISTSSLVIDNSNFPGLTTGVTYYYRVRAASKYTVGTFQSCNSGTQQATAGDALSFSQQPIGFSVCTGSAGQALTVSSNNNPSYQWYSNTVNSNSGGAAVGSTTTNFTPPTTTPGTYYYYCVITRGTTTLASNVATVTVVPSPTLSSVSQASPVCGGQSATINLTGLVPNSVNNIFYHIGSGTVQSATAVATTAAGTASFVFLTANGNAVLYIDSIRSSCTTIFSGINTTLAVNASPNSPTSAVDTAKICAPGTIPLAVNNAGGSPVNWYSAPSGGSPILTNNPSFTTPSYSSNTTVTYYAQTVAANGCSSPRVAFIGNLTVPSFTLTNSTIYSGVPTGPSYIVNMPYTASNNLTQYSIAWTSANATAAGFLAVTNASLPASPIPISLNVSAVAGQIYSGTITASNTTGCSTVAIPFSIQISNIQVGDYGSVMTGNWAVSGAGTTWKTWDGTAFTGVTAAAPSASTNIWIIGGYTVSTGATGTFACKDLHVLDGILQSGNQIYTTGASISINGNVIEVAANGKFGGTNVGNAADGLCLTVAGSPISFSGTISGNVLTVASTGGTLTAGLLITGSGVTSGTTIVNQLTGTAGAAGTYTISNSQIISTATTMNVVCHIKGVGGIINLSRLIISRGSASLGNNPLLLIDHDVTLNHHGTTFNASYLYGDGATSALYSSSLNPTVLSINTGKTVTLHKWASVCLGSSVGSISASKFTLNVDGTLSFLPGVPDGYPAGAVNQGTLSYNGVLNMNGSNATNPFTINIGATGKINVTEIYTAGISGTAAGTSAINIAPGGELNIDSLADFRKSTQTVTGVAGAVGSGGAFNLRGTARMRIGSTAGINAVGTNTGHILTGTRNFSNRARYIYVSTGALPTTGNALDTAGAVIDSTSGAGTYLSLTKSVVLRDSLQLTRRLFTGNSTLTVNNIKNFSSTNYIVTDQTSGRLRQTGVTYNDVFYPVGALTTSPASTYNPVTISNIGTTDNFGVNVSTGVPSNLAVDSAINRSWSIVEDVPGGSIVAVTPQWNATSSPTEIGAGFNVNTCAVVHSNGTALDYAGSVGPALGTGPYTKLGSGFTSFLATDRFGVGYTKVRKFRSRQSGFWSEFDSWDISNAAGGYSPSEGDIPNTDSSEVFIQPAHEISIASGNTNTYCGNLTLSGKLNLSTSPIDTFKIGGSWNKTATGLLNANDRPVYFTGNRNVTISGIGGQKFERLYVSKSALANKVTLSDSIAISKELKMITGTLDLAAKNITLLSDVASTASFAAMPASGAAISYSGLGRFEVQRYINSGTGGTRHQKSWQLLCAPIDPAENISIKQSWMENAGPNLNPNPGYGTQIVGPGGTTNGFDVATASASIKTFDPVNNLWQFAPNTNQGVANTQGYMLFVRGSRAITTLTNADSTVLRAKGKLLIGDNINGPSIPAAQFQSVANPYASAINFDGLNKTNLQDYLYVFDPTLGGSYGLGGFNAITAGGSPQSLSTYYPTTTSQNRYIQSGQAFFVYNNTASPGSISFNEAAKVSGSRIVLRENNTANVVSPSLRSTLNYQAADGSYKLSDGNLLLLDESNSDDASDDASKYFNNGDNLSISNNGLSYAIVKRKPIHAADSVVYHLMLARVGNYQLALNANNWSSPCQTARLIDKFLNASTTVNLNSAFIYPFTVTTDQQSRATDRFVLVFNYSNAGTLPVRFIHEKATVNKNKVIVSWSVANELDVTQYAIERSADGKDFVKIGVIGVANPPNNNYVFDDQSPIFGPGYYRIKAVDVNGSYLYSAVLKVGIKNFGGAPFAIYPNPVIEETVTVFASSDLAVSCKYKLYDQTGRCIQLGNVDFSTQQQQKIHLPAGLVAGIYQLVLETEDSHTYCISLHKK